MRVKKLLIPVKILVELVYPPSTILLLIAVLAPLSIAMSGALAMLKIMSMEIVEIPWRTISLFSLFGLLGILIVLIAYRVNAFLTHRFIKNLHLGFEADRKSGLREFLFSLL